MKERITRGENWLLASCRLTTVREKTTPAVVIVAPDTTLSSQVAALVDMLHDAGRTVPGGIARSTAQATSATTAPPSTMRVGSRNRLSRNA